MNNRSGPWCDFWKSLSGSFRCVLEHWCWSICQPLCVCTKPRSHLRKGCSAVPILQFLNIAQKRGMKPMLKVSYFVKIIKTIVKNKGTGGGLRELQFYRGGCALYVIASLFNPSMINLHIESVTSLYTLMSVHWFVGCLVVGRMVWRLSDLLAISNTSLLLAENLFGLYMIKFSNY